MPKGKKYGGRQKGTPNRLTKDLLERCAVLDVQPFDILLYFAKGDWKALGYDSPSQTRMSNGVPYEVERITPDLRMNAAKEACQYLYPKRKAIEIDTNETMKPVVIQRKDGTRIELGAKAIEVDSKVVDEDK